MKKELLYYVNHSAAVLSCIRKKDNKHLQTGQTDIATGVGQYCYTSLNLNF